jgi:hypothetical protein
MFAFEIETAIADTRAKLASAQAKFDEIDVLLHGDPQELVGAVNRATGRVYNAETATRKVLADRAVLENDVMRLMNEIRKGQADLEEAKAREDQAREVAHEVAGRMASVDAHLENRGLALAADLRELLGVGEDVLVAMAAINAALPPGERLTPTPMLSRLIDRPERVVSEKMVDVWLDETNRQPVPESLLWSPEGTEKARAKRLCGIRGGGNRAFLIPVREMTFVPAHRFDWLSAEDEPLPQTRLEGIPDDLMAARNEAVAADEAEAADAVA